MIDDEAAATESGRWLTGSELLVTQAWPVHAALHLKKGYRWCPFHVDLPSGRVSRVMRQQGRKFNEPFRDHGSYVAFPSLPQRGSTYTHVAVDLRCDAVTTS